MIAPMSSDNLVNQFLIAMPSLLDPNFHQTVTYLCAHSDEGAMGLVINRPLQCELGEILAQMKLEPPDKTVRQAPVYCGGPVHADRGFVLHESDGPWESSIKVNDSLSVTTSRGILHAIAENGGPENFLVALGYAGWAAGQLEAEIKDNAWLHVAADLDIIFNIPSEQRWAAATALLGIDFNQLSAGVGHA